MPRTSQAPRWIVKDIMDRRFFHAFTDYGVKMVEHGFFLRITRPELFKDTKFMNELGHEAIYQPYTNDLEDDIKKSILTDECVENLLFNLRMRHGN